MDILRKELNSIYSAQHLETEQLSEDDLADVRKMAETLISANNACAVVTDASCDYCYIYSGGFGSLMGFTSGCKSFMEASSSDEDVVYDRINPEDLVDKRMLEYEFFKMTDSLPSDVKMSYKATCRLRMRDKDDNYRYVDNSTQVIRLSPAGKIWLILCCYDLSPDQNGSPGISPRIINNQTGEISFLSFDARRRNFLSEREKEILRLIQDGKPSKQIADILGISINTVNRHRQNIIAKLSVGNSIEAITAANAMKLL